MQRAGSWTILTFGKHEGQTFPQILLSDPDWFFWLVAQGTLYGRLAEEAHDLAKKAKRIKIPKGMLEDTEVEYQHERDGRFCGIQFASARIPAQPRAARCKVLDLSYPRQCKAYDKRGYRILIASVRHHYFGGRNLTKDKCEKFFSDEKNFL